MAQWVLKGSIRGPAGEIPDVSSFLALNEAGNLIQNGVEVRNFSVVKDGYNGLSVTTGGSNGANQMLLQTFSGDQYGQFHIDTAPNAVNFYMATQGATIGLFCDATGSSVGTAENPAHKVFVNDISDTASADGKLAVNLSTMKTYVTNAGNTKSNASFYYGDVCMYINRISSSASYLYPKLNTFSVNGITAGYEGQLIENNYVPYLQFSKPGVYLVTTNLGEYSGYDWDKVLTVKTPNSNTFTLPTGPFTFRIAVTETNNKLRFISNKRLSGTYNDGTILVSSPLTIEPIDTPQITENEDVFDNMSTYLYGTMKVVGYNYIRYGSFTTISHNGITENTTTDGHVYNATHTFTFSKTGVYSVVIDNPITAMLNERYNVIFNADSFRPVVGKNEFRITVTSVSQKMTISYYGSKNSYDEDTVGLTATVSIEKIA